MTFNIKTQVSTNGSQSSLNFFTKKSCHFQH